ncbi:RES family NAD+ phosphorylase [Paenibacillus sp. TC-CSREp1]|uniref:RES family NAD+ phosphorylase n=1 Tax=Paenibacillus sp. TC-CSREp1 TaxID=3410089 RepID=UPI003D075961
MALDLMRCTVCSSCGDEIFEFFELRSYPIEPYQKYVQDYIFEPAELEDDEAPDCEVCNSEIEPEEAYHSITVPIRMLYSLADELSKNIGGCEFCHGNELRYMEASYNSDKFESSPIDLGGSSYDAAGYLEWCEVPDSLIGTFLDLMKCPSCHYGRDPETGNNPSGGIFKANHDVYTTKEVNYFYGEDSEFDAEEFSNFAKRYEEEISLSDLLAFRETLRTQPLLAYKDKTGVAIYNVLLKHFNDQAYATLRMNEIELYRGRTRTIDSRKPYDMEQMWSAPQGKTSHGRYNFIGVSVLYVSDHVEAVPYEINPAHDQVLDIATFKITKKRLRLFDLGSFDPAFQGFFSELNEESNQLKSAYLLPNYIGACCSDIGYDGVSYGGVHQLEDREGYTNYALFNIEPGLDLEPAEPDVKTYKPRIKIGLDYQEKKPARNVFDPTKYF